MSIYFNTKGRIVILTVRKILKLKYRGGKDLKLNNTTNNNTFLNVTNNTNSNFVHQPLERVKSHCRLWRSTNDGINK